MLFHNEPILRNGEVISYLTSANYGHHLGAAIGLGYVPCKDQTLGDVLNAKYEIDIAGSVVRAEISSKAFYDPKAEKVKM